jgi:hypothetical protein
MATKNVILICHPAGERPFKTTRAKLLRDNAHDEWVVDEVKALKPGQSVQLGGGAQPGFVVTRAGTSKKKRRRKSRR